jgi:hypothetical protein
LDAAGRDCLKPAKLAYRKQLQAMLPAVDLDDHELAIASIHEDRLTDLNGAVGCLLPLPCVCL